MTAPRSAVPYSIVRVILSADYRSHRGSKKAEILTAIAPLYRRSIPSR